MTLGRSFPKPKKWGCCHLKIELCGEDRLRITLNQADLEQLSISFEELDYGRMEIRRIIWELLDEANRRTGFDSSKGKLLIEAMPLLDGGCVLYFTILPREYDQKNRPKKLHLRRLGGPYVYEFQGADELMSVCSRLSREYPDAIPKSTVYQMDHSYRLVIYTREDTCKTCAPLLSEYGSPAGEGSAAAAFAAEHGKMLAEGDAVSQIGRHLS